MKKNLLFIIILCCICITSHAEHLVGAKFSYRKLSVTSLEVKLEIERDCAQGTAPFDNSLRVGIYGESTNLLMQTVTLPRTSIIKVPITGDCNGISRCVELATFMGTISLNFSFEDTSGYYMQWERCCMSNLLLNINDPGSTPLSPLIEIPAGTFNDELSSNYSSPVANKVFNPTACLNTPFRYQFNYTDPDGDSIAYRFITPNSGGYSSQFNPAQNTGPKPYDMVSYYPGLSEEKFIFSSDTPKLNPVTGELTFIPSQIGIYLIGYAVDEFRNGKLIGTVYHHSIISTEQCVNVILEQPQDQYVELNSNVMFRVKHQNPTVTFQWQVNENNFGYKNLIGETSDSLVLTNIDASIFLNKYRCAIDKGNCIDYSFEVAARLVGTGINTNKKQALIIYPNPSNSIVTIRTDEYDLFEVYSLDGKLLMISNLPQAVDISTLENGIYLIKAINSRNHNIAFAKVIKSGD
jgi:hypothetical protein